MNDKWFVRLGVVVIVAMFLAPMLGACVGPTVEEKTPPTVEEEEPVIVDDEPTVERQPDVLIGAVYPLSGDGATSGEAYRIGIEMAMDVINNPHAELDVWYAETEGLPNLDGAKCLFEFADSETSPEKGAAEVERLITDENVPVIVGLAYSSATAAAQPVTERYEIPLINGGSTSPPLTDQGFEFFWRVGPHDGMSTVAMFDFLDDYKKQTGAEINTIGLLHEDTEVGVESGIIAKGIAEGRGYEVVEEVQYRRDSATLTTEIQLMKAANPDVLMPTSYVGDAILIVQGMQELDFNPDIVLWSGGSVALPFWLESVGDEGEYQMTRSRWSSDLGDAVPAINELADMFDEYSGGKALAGGDLSFVGYTVAMVACDAVNRAGSADPAAIQEALYETDIEIPLLPVPWGVQFDPETHQNQRATMKIDQLYDSVWYTIWPFDVASKDVTYPIPPWSDR